MRLRGFKYLVRRRILILTFIIALVSMLFSITAFSFLGFYNGFNAYLGEGEDIIAIYESGSRTPFSGLVPMYLAERMYSIKGIQASSPEVIAPSVMKGESIFIRGIIPEEFSKLKTLTILEGDTLDITDLNSAIVGKDLSQLFTLKPGDKVLVFGVLAEKYQELQIKGIFESRSSMDDEVLVPLYVGQWLRAVDYSYVTLIRVKIDRSQVDPSKLFDEIAKEATEATESDTSEENEEKPTEGIVPTVKVSFKPEDIGTDKAMEFMKSYLDKYGVTKEAIVLLSIMVFIFASASVAGASTMLIQQHKHEIDVLRSIGASKKTIKADLLFKILTWSLASSLLGIILATATLMLLDKFGSLQVLSHRILFQLDPLIVALNFFLISSLIIISISRSGVKR